MDKPFLSLPVEVQLLLLSHLHFRDLLRCRCICKHLLKLIDSSPALKLIIELGAAARKDNPAYRDTSIQKLQQLQKMNVAWANCHWKHRVPIHFAEAISFSKFSGGCFFYVLDEESSDAETEKEELHTVVLWMRLPSRRNLRPSIPKMLLLAFEMHDMAIDVSRDLVIAIELIRFRAVKDYTYECRVRPISITTGEPHPGASKSVISVRFSSKEDIEFSSVSCISGNHFAVLFTRDLRHKRGEFDLFLLWDWSTGIRKACMNSFLTAELWESFCFITLDSILIPSTIHGHLNIFRFDGKPDSLTHICTFLLPETANKPGLRHIDVCSEPPPSLAPTCAIPTDDEPPFIVDPDDAIVVIRLDYYYPPRGRIETEDEDSGLNLPQIVAVPRRLFAKTLRFPWSNLPVLECKHISAYTRFMDDPHAKRHPHCHSEAWIHFTRWSVEPTPPDFSLSCAYGSRYLGMTSRLEHPHLIFSDIILYDFNLRNERRGTMLVEPNVRPSADVENDCEEDRFWNWDDKGNGRWPVRPSRIVTDRKIVQNTEIFTHPFLTTLPHRLTDSDCVFDWDSAVLDEERIIGLRMEDGIIKSMDVLVV